MINLFFYSVLTVLLATTSLAVWTKDDKTRLFTMITSFFALFLTLLFMDDQFIAAAGIIIYVGAIAILFILALMFVTGSGTDVGRTQAAAWSTLVSYLTFNPLYHIVKEVTESLNDTSSKLAWDVGVRLTELQQPAYGHIDAILYHSDQLSKIADLLYGPYLDCFFASGWILLAAMFGTIILTTPKLKRKTKPEIPSDNNKATVWF